MEKLTITKLGTPKEMSGTSQKTSKPYKFNKIGFQTQEHGTQWFDLSYNEHHNLKEGQTYEFETTSREYNGKTYWSAKFPKKEDANGERLEKVLNELTTIKLMLQIINDNTKPKKKDVVIDERSYPTPEDEGIDLDDPNNF